MLVKILGSAAGGGFPQWNCACVNCRAMRTGSFHGKARSQTQVAVSADGHTWFLMGASPDLRAQIENTSELHPRDGVRQSPIAGAVLANADLDHVLGLLLLREMQPLRVYSTASVYRLLFEDNTMFGMLHRKANQISWTEVVAGKPFSLHSPNGEDSGVRCRAISLAAHFPAYVTAGRQSELNGQEASLGLLIDAPSGKRVAYMPAVPALDKTLMEEFASADVLLFDGTFWSDDELIRVQSGGQTAHEMGHIPISSPEGSLAKLAGLHRPRKIYIHVNNTNPVLDEAGPEYRRVREAGWEVAEDGWQFDL